MKKIIIGVFVLALLVSSVAYADRGSRDDRDDDTTTATSTKSELRNKKNNSRNASSTVNVTCVSKAVSEREDDVMDAWEAFDTKITAILTERKSDLITAWTLTDSKERRSEVKKVWETAKKDKKAASAEYKKAKKAVWAEFKKEAKACGGTDGMEASGESDGSEKIEI